MERLDNKHAQMFGQILNQMGVIKVEEDEFLHYGLLVERLYLYTQKEYERDLREQVNQQQS